MDDLHSVKVLDALISNAKSLDANRLKALLELSKALQNEVAVTVGANSDLMKPLFIDEISIQLTAYHSFNEQALTKKTFEYLFKKACQANGSNAVITSNPVNPGADVTVDDVAFSLKTEGADHQSTKNITFSKFMEARWIRDCLTVEDFARETTRRVIEHLSSYQRILVLRSFEEAENYRYMLFEVPIKLLMEVGKLTPNNFTPRTKNGGSSAKIYVGDKRAFTLRLDGSVEKVTISGIDISLCKFHGSWIVPKS